MTDATTNQHLRELANAAVSTYFGKLTFQERDAKMTAVINTIHEAGRQQGMSQANALWEMAKAEQAVPVACQWVPMHERAPAPDTDCVVYLRYSLDQPPFIATDRWEMQSEDPTGMGGPTMETGYGWRDNYESDVIAWMAVGELPPEAWDQRLPTAGTTEQAKGQP